MNPNIPPHSPLHCPFDSLTEPGHFLFWPCPDEGDEHRLRAFATHFAQKHNRILVVNMSERTTARVAMESAPEFETDRLPGRPRTPFWVQIEQMELSEKRYLKRTDTTFKSVQHVRNMAVIIGKRSGKTFSVQKELGGANIMRTA